MEVKRPNHVSFPSQLAPENGSRPESDFQAKLVEEKAKKPGRNVNITCKYDRKQMRVRLEVEEWMYDRLQELYDCQVSD